MKPKKAILRVGTVGDYPPFIQIDPVQQTLSGSDVYLMQQFAQANHFQLEWVQTYWPTLDQDLKRHSFDIAVGGIGLTEHRRQQFLVTKSLLCEPKSLLVHQDLMHYSSAQINQPQFRLLYHPERSRGFDLANQWSQLQVITEWNVEDIFLKLLSKQADGFITHHIEAIYRQNMFKHVLRALSLDDCVVVEEIGYVMHPSQEKLQIALNNWIIQHQMGVSNV